MEGHTWDQLLGGLDSLWSAVVDQEISILLVLDAKLVEMLLELISQLLHGRHIGEQDWLGESLFDQFDLGSCKLTAQEVIFRDIQEFNGLGGMEVFLDMLFTIHLADGRFGDYVVSIVETIMLDIVAKSCHNER